MSVQCDMYLDNPCGCYHAGETISGHIKLQLQARQLIKALGLSVSGYAATAWIQTPKQKKKEKKSTNTVSSTKKTKTPLAFENRMDYLSTINYFMGSEAATPKIIESGVYNYNFSVRLPDQCPSSYEGEHGHIRYMMQVFMDTGEPERYIAYSRTLQVERVRDLREQAGVLDNACDLQREEHTSRVKFWQRPLNLELNIQRQGYAPGESISVHAKLYNPQHLLVTELVYKLNLIVTHLGIHKRKRRDSKLERHNLVTSVHALHTPDKSSVFQHLQLLQVPITPPTLTIAECQCLQLEYEVQVVVKTNDLKRSIHAELPITIGSISLDASVEQKEYTRPTFESSIATLNVARSMEDLSRPSAPLETPTPTMEHVPILERNNPLSVSMCSLATNFREAEFMTATNLNKPNRRNMRGDQVDFRPRYLYYEMEHEESENML